MALGMAASVAVVAFTGGRQLLAGILQLPLWAFALTAALVVGSWLGQGVAFAALTPRGTRGQLLAMTRAFLGGDFPALVTPFGSGGIPGGIFALGREGLSAGEAGAVVALHSLLTSVFFTATGVFAAFILPAHLAHSTVAVWSGFAAATLVLVVIGWLALAPRHAVGLLEGVVSSRVGRRFVGEERAARIVAAAEHEAGVFTTGVKRLTRERPGALLLSFAGLAFSRICLAAVLLVIMYGLGWRGDPVAVVAVAIAAMVVAVASPTPGGSGAVEPAMTALLATITTAPVAGAAALLWRALTFYVEMLVGWLAFSRYVARR